MTKSQVCLFQNRAALAYQPMSTEIVVSPKWSLLYTRDHLSFTCTKNFLAAEKETAQSSPIVFTPCLNLTPTTCGKSDWKLCNVHVPVHHLNLVYHLYLMYQFTICSGQTSSNCIKTFITTFRIGSNDKSMKVPTIVFFLSQLMTKWLKSMKRVRGEIKFSKRIRQSNNGKRIGPWVGVKWSACSPSNLKIQVRFRSFFCKICVWKERK